MVRLMLLLVIAKLATSGQYLITDNDDCSAPWLPVDYLCPELWPKAFERSKYVANGVAIVVKWIAGGVSERLATFLRLLLLVAGDVESNPGPVSNDEPVPKAPRLAAAVDVVDPMTGNELHHMDPTTDYIPDQPIFRDPASDYEPEVQPIVRDNWAWIRDYQKTGRPIKDTFNIRTEGFDLGAVEMKLTEIFRNAEWPFKLNVMPGYLLKRKHPEQTPEEPGVTYYYPSGNTRLTVLDGFKITTAADLQEAIQRIRDVDIEAELSQDRPDTGYFFYKVLNVTMEIYKQRDHFIGRLPTAPDIEVEAYVKNNRSVISTFRNEANNNMCFFRALAYHKERCKNVERKARALLQQWGQYTGQSLSPDTFPGVKLADITRLEDCFKINIRVYSIEKRQPIQTETNEPQIRVKFGAYCVQNSMGRYQDNMNLHLSGDHVSYITRINSYCKSWLCPYCKRFFHDKWNMQRHVKEMSCAEIQYKYPGGGYGQKQNIFEKLNMHGIHVALERRFYEMRAGFDFECRFEKLAENGTKLQFMQKLIPASVSLASNVPGFTDVHCFRNRDPDELVKQFVGYLEDMSAKAREIMEAQYADVIKELKNRTKGIKNLREALGQATDPMEKKALNREIKQREIYEQLQREFNMWLRRLVVLGFNSGKFDLNLIKDHFVKHFIRTKKPDDISVIKRGNSFMSISSDDLVFLDMTNYLGPAVSYDKFIKAYGVSQTKGIWPYEWFVDFDLLKQDHLPPREAFYSILRQKGISEEEYERAKETWRTNGFRTMDDMLVWYNNLDTAPMLEAIKKMWDNFKTMGLEMFKTGAISLPGLAMQHLFARVPQINCFALFGPKDKHWDEIVRDNIVGGPSIVFTRKHTAGETILRGLTKLAQAVLGYDANALYLWATGQEMPVGIPTFYEPDGEVPHSIPFNPTDESRASIEGKVQQNLRTPLLRKWSWGQKELNYVTWTLEKYQQQNANRKLTLRHKYGGGQMSFHNGEKAIFVDGFIPELDTILQFHGCYFHGHSCMRGRMDEELRLEKEENTETIREFLRSTGKTLVECYECDFKKEQDSNPALAAYIRTFRHGYMDNPNGAKILRQMQQDQFFGLVECDIQVPWWIPGMREKMDEMAPVFKNINIGRDDLDEDMKQFAIDNKIMSQPRRTLIGSFFGEKILVATPLLKWYLKHGLVVTRVYRAAQYRPSTVFRHLADEVTSHRSAADRDPNRRVLADMYKLLGNSYYGKCLTNKLKQSNVTYMGEEKAGRAVNEPTFESLEEVADGVYEVCMKKSKIEFDLPTLIAFFVYSYAKQRMLEFYYDFIDQILDREDFEMIEMDTDSLYFACSAKTLEEAVPPHKRAAYERLKTKFLAVDTDPFSPTYDQRTPGIFKLEWSGRGMIALNSKTYFGWDPEGTTKLSTKGISKQTNQLGQADFEGVLASREPVEGTNYGFRLHGRNLAQYQQLRKGLTFFYAKRRVIGDDGIRTKALDIFAVQYGAPQDSQTAVELRALLHQTRIGLRAIQKRECTNLTSIPGQVATFARLIMLDVTQIKSSFRVNAKDLGFAVHRLLDAHGFFLDVGQHWAVAARLLNRLIEDNVDVQRSSRFFPSPPDIPGLPVALAAPTFAPMTSIISMSGSSFTARFGEPFYIDHLPFYNLSYDGPPTASSMTFAVMTAHLELYETPQLEAVTIPLLGPGNISMTLIRQKVFSFHSYCRLLWKGAERWADLHAIATQSHIFPVKASFPLFSLNGPTVKLERILTVGAEKLSAFDPWRADLSMATPIANVDPRKHMHVSYMHHRSNLTLSEQSPGIADFLHDRLPTPAGEIREVLFDRPFICVISKPSSDVARFANRVPVMVMTSASLDPVKLRSF